MKKILFALTIFSFAFVACSKMPADQLKSQLDQHSSQLIVDWTDVQLRLIKNTTGVTHVAYSRHFSYTGIAVYESLAAGDNKYNSIVPFLNGSINVPANPSANHIYHPLSANAAFAAMFRYFYAAKEANLLVIDSLETVYKTKYESEMTANYDAAASIEFGKSIAAAVIDFSKTDGASSSNTPYTQQGEGFWEPTAPAYASPAVPGWGNNRTILQASLNNTTPASPPTFSTNEGTPFYNMVKEVFEVSKTLTNEQKAIASFWDDAPNGKYVTAFGHWFSILKQILANENTTLMKGADAYLRLGITMNESSISCWKSKYAFNQMRPLTYIRKYMARESWNPYITTPPHPEYLAAHAAISSSAAHALESIFGKNYSFTDHTYDGVGMTPRNYTSIEAAGDEAGISRLYGGIHYRLSIERGKTQGVQVGENVQNLLITKK